MPKSTRAPLQFSTLSGTLLVLVACAIFALVLGTALWGRLLANPGPHGQDVTVVIPRGAGVLKVGQVLGEAGVIENPRLFQLAVRVMNLSSTLQAGEYQFPAGASMRTVINKLAVGDHARRKLTIPEGWTVKQVTDLLRDAEGLTGKMIEVEEGWLLPETYVFTYGEDRADVMMTMRRAMENAVAEAWASRAPDLPLNSPQDLLTLASIVEKETALPQEYAKVAGVYINRLRKGMPLQSDPTVIYGAANGFGQIEFENNNLTRAHLTEDQPYNTYVHPGLPPTAIALPGRAALMATANPAQTDALFFVADLSTGGHVFAKTYAEHSQNVRRYVQQYKAARRAAAEEAAQTPAP